MTRVIKSFPYLGVEPQLGKVFEEDSLSVLDHEVLDDEEGGEVALLVLLVVQHRGQHLHELAHQVPVGAAHL